MSPHIPPLRQRTFRLLRVLSLNTEDRRVTISLSVYPLDDPPEFEALSYTWGNATDDEDEGETAAQAGLQYIAECNGVDILMTRNLFDGLSELATPGASNYLWVDALCINQEDLEERASQVLLMGDIYASAIRVIVWLGNDTTDLENFIYMHEKCADIETYLTSPERGIAEPNMFDPKLLGSLAIDSATWLKRWHSYGRFYHRQRWFRRAWILQEVAVANEIVVRCAYAELNWKVMYTLAFHACYTTAWWRYSVGSGPGSLPTTSPEPDLIGVNYFRQLSRSVGNEQSPWGNAIVVASPRDTWTCAVQRLLVAQLPCNATNPLDKIYSLLGVASRLLPVGEKLPWLVDYRKPVEEVYSSFTKVLLLDLPLLDNLSLVEDRNSRKLHNLPSWCPDYSIAQGNWSFLFLSRGTNIFNCCRDMNSARQTRFISGSTLTVNGKKIDQVETSAMGFFDMTAKYAIDQYLELGLKLVKSGSRTAQEALEILWRTMIADTSAEPPTFKPCHPAPESIAPCFTAWVYHQCLITYLAFVAGSGRDGKAYLDRLQDLFDAYDNDSLLPNVMALLERAKDLQATESDPLSNSIAWMSGHAMKYQKLLRNQRKHRVFTTHEHRLGIGAYSIEKGDEVWLLRGGLLPFILRWKIADSAYVLIGESYVHGVMHGEALEELDLEQGFNPVNII